MIGSSGVCEYRTCNNKKFPRRRKISLFLTSTLCVQRIAIVFFNNTSHKYKQFELKKYIKIYSFFKRLPRLNKQLIIVALSLFSLNHKFFLSMSYSPFAIYQTASVPLS